MFIGARLARTLMLIAFLLVTLGSSVAFATASTASNVNTARAVPYISSYTHVATGPAPVQPFSVAIDSAGNIYVGEVKAATAASAYVEKIDAVTGQVTQFAGGLAQALTPGTSTCASPDPATSGPIVNTVGDGCPANQTYLGGAHGLATWKDPASNVEYLYILDAMNYIHRVNLATGMMEWVAGVTNPATGAATTGWNGDGPVATAQLMGPAVAAGIAMDANGNLYFGDGGTNGPSIRMVSNNATTCQTAQGGPYTAPCLITVVNYTSSTTTKPVYACELGYLTVSTAMSATTNGVWGLAFDGSGNLYLAENKCNAYRKVSKNPQTGIVDQNSTFSTIIYGASGTLTAKYMDTTTQPIVKMNARSVIGVPGSDDMYFATGAYIWLYDSTTGWVRPIVGGSTGCTGTPNPTTGTPGSGANENVGCPGPYVTIYPNTAGGQMATDAGGNLYIADYNNYAVVKFATGDDFVGTAPQVKNSTPATQYVLLHGPSLTGATQTGAAFTAALTTSSSTFTPLSDGAPVPLAAFRMQSHRIALRRRNRVRHGCYVRSDDLWTGNWNSHPHGLGFRQLSGLPTARFRKYSDRK